MSLTAEKEVKTTKSKSNNSLAMGSMADDKRLAAQRRSLIQLKLKEGVAQREEDDDTQVKLDTPAVEEETTEQETADVSPEEESEVEPETDPEALEAGQKQTASVFKSVMEDAKSATDQTKEKVDDTPGWGATIWQGVKDGAKMLGDMAIRFIPGVGAIYGLIKDIGQARKRHENWKSYSSINSEMENDSSGMVSVFKEKVAFAMGKARRGFLDAMYAVVSSAISAFTSIADLVSAGAAKLFTTPISIAKGVVTGIKTLYKLMRGGWKLFSGTLHKDRKEAVRLLVESAAGVGKHAGEKEKALEILARINPNFTEEWALNALNGGDHHFEQSTIELYNTMDSKAGE